MHTEISRRSMLATTGRAALAVVAGSGVAVSAVDYDPILPALDAYRNAARASAGLYAELDEAGGEAYERTGTHRPISLVQWRNHFISGREIDQMRERLLEEWAKGDPILTILVEGEYELAKEREQELIAAGLKWDARNGLTELREKYERASAKRSAAVELLSVTTPTTVGGGAALVGAVAEEFEAGEMVWFDPALKNAANALRILAGGGNV